MLVVGVATTGASKTHGPRSNECAITYVANAGVLFEAADMTKTLATVPNLTLLTTAGMRVGLR